MPRPKTNQPKEPCVGCKHLALCGERKLACTAMLEYVHMGRTEREPGIPLHVAYGYIWSDEDQPPQKIRHLLTEIEQLVSSRPEVSPGVSDLGQMMLSLSS